MLGYKYNGFVIKQFSFRKVTAWSIFKDDVLYSVMSFTTPAIAKKTLDLVFPAGSYSELRPFHYTN